MSQNLQASAIKSYLTDLGYDAALMSSSFRLEDGTIVAIAAFAHAPADARTACVAVIEANEGSSEIVRSCLALAAPIVFVCGRNGLEWWKQGATEPERLRLPIPPADIPMFFKTHADELAPSAVYRAKTWGRFDAKFQLSFVDFGLMPLVESQIGATLVQIISRQVQSLKSLLKWDVINEAKGQWLLKVVFWLVSAKILHDKQVKMFKSLDLLNAEGVLNAVGEHFDTTAISITSEKQ
ncbi:MAG TPA: hypothetical protein PK992_06810, partial [Planctomycetaceae bacterium]|nr:hypothetical protein [Planctomycetaceae bacterium]